MKELKQKVISRLNLQGMVPDDIIETEPLLGGRWSIDSIDILDIVMMIEEDYGVKIENREDGNTAFASFAALSKYVESHLPQ